MKNENFYKLYLIFLDTYFTKFPASRLKKCVDRNFKRISYEPNIVTFSTYTVHEIGLGKTRDGNVFFTPDSGRCNVFLDEEIGAASMRRLSRWAAETIGNNP